MNLNLNLNLNLNMNSGSNPTEAPRPIRPDSAPVKRVEFHVPASSSAIDAIIEQAALWEHQAIGIVGAGGIQSFIAAEKKAKQLSIKPIFGIQAIVIDDDSGTRCSCRIYARTNRGKTNLFKLVSSGLAYAAGSPGTFSFPRSELEQNREGLLFASGFAGSELLEAALTHSRDRAERVAGLYDVFEIEPVCLQEQPEDAHFADFTARLEQVQRLICALGRQLGKPVVATGNAGQLAPDNVVSYFRTTGEMLRDMAYLGDELAYETVVANTNRLAGLVEAYDLVPQELFLPNLEDSDRRIRSMCHDAAASRYGHPLPDIVAVRLERELELIVGHGFASPYLLAASVAARAAADGYRVGTRGAVGSSLVPYFLGISEVNPLPPHYVCPNCRHSEWQAAFSGTGSGFDWPDKPCPSCGETMRGDGHNIPYEMFLGLAGNKLPDIDLNVAFEYQGKAFDDLRVQLGEAQVLRAGRASGSLHPGGVIVIPAGQQAERFTPVQRTGDDLPPGWLQTHFDYHDLEKTLLKLDILAHDDLSVLRLLHDATGVDPAAIPMNDPRVLSLFRSPAELNVTARQIRTTAATYGIPEMGTAYVRGILEETQPATFADLLQVSGLSHGVGTWEGNARELLRSGTCTLADCVALRDNLMLKLLDRGSGKQFAFRFADSVRRGKGVPDSWLGETDKYDLPLWFVDSCRRIGYLFPKAHAVAYVISAIRNAYFKLYYPLEFYAAYYSVRGGCLDLELALQGDEAIWNRLESAGSEQSPTHDPIAVRVLEVALEMTARGFRFQTEDPLGRKSLRITDDRRALPVPFQ